MNTIHEVKYIYTYRYDYTESELCKLESKCIFNQEEENKQLFTSLKIDPSISAFIKKRLEVILCSSDYEALIHQIKEQNIRTDGFKVEYLILDGDTTGNKQRLNKLKDVGYSIDTYPDYHNPTIIYGLCYYEGVWYFGVLIKNSFDWLDHKKKPYSYSNSINMNIAKALVNIAVAAKQDQTLLDGCCGVGTIMLEACYAGVAIEGCDISWKTCNNARENLAHFSYLAEVYCSDIKDIRKRYDAVILDLPYNLFTSATDSEILNIINSSSQIADRLVIVSTSDITSLISVTGLCVSEHCSVSKRGKANFTRRIWVCEKL